MAVKDLSAKLKPNVIVRGPLFAEPIQVIVTIPMGEAIKLVSKGLTTGQVHEPILCASTSQVHAIHDPVRLGWEPLVKIEHYHVGAEQILAAAE
jgi:hypothetical protein